MFKINFVMRSKIESVQIRQNVLLLLFRNYLPLQHLSH